MTESLSNREIRELVDIIRDARDRGYHLTPLQAELVCKAERLSGPRIYNHAFSLCFEVNSEQPDGSDLTNDMVCAAVMGRINQLYAENKLHEAIDIFDTEEYES
jgi:hypothetical protein